VIEAMKNVTTIYTELISTLPFLKRNENLVLQIDTKEFRVMTTQS
jgi:hypothetical protein